MTRSLRNNSGLKVKQNFQPKMDADLWIRKYALEFSMITFPG